MSLPNILFETNIPKKKLPITATEDEITEWFGQHSTVHSVALIKDRETGRPVASASSR